jgi:hypothetical protein
MTVRGVQRQLCRIASVAAAVAVAAGPASSPAEAQAPPAGSQGAVAMAATIHAARSCLTDLSATDRRMLVLRFGIGGRSHESDQSVATRLGLTVAAVTMREAEAVRALAADCGIAAQPTSTASPTASAAPATTPVPAAVPHGSSGGIAADEALAIALIVVCLIAVGHEFHKALFAPRPRV